MNILKMVLLGYAIYWLIWIIGFGIPLFIYVKFNKNSEEKDEKGGNKE